MKTNKLLLLALCGGAFCSSAFAHTGWYTTVTNKSSNSILISAAYDVSDFSPEDIDGANSLNIS